MTSKYKGQEISHPSPPPVPAVTSVTTDPLMTLITSLVEGATEYYILDAVRKLHVCGVFDEQGLSDLVSHRKSWRRCPLDDDIKDAIEDYVLGNEDEERINEGQLDIEASGSDIDLPARRASLSRAESR